MSTFLHGIGTVQFLDKSAEVIELSGMDITSLAKTGVINYEHKSDVPAQLVGKILKAKKIFTKDDCSNDHELYFWNKVKTPYLYIMAELLDDYCDSAKHVAGILRYDRDKKDQNEYAMAWFSVEGSEIPNSRKISQVISRAIARKVTLTTAPCNQSCAVEILDNQAPKIKDDFEEIFKNDKEAIDLFKSGEGVKLYEDFLAKRDAEGPSLGGKAPKDPYAEYEGKGIHIGRTSSGKKVWSHGPARDYDFNPAEHKEAAEHHKRAIVTADNPKLIDNHVERMKQHNAAALSGGRQENRAALSLNHKDKIAQEQGKQQMALSEKIGKSEKLCKKHKELKKDATNMSAPPPEPNKANAAAMQSGAMSPGPSFSDAMSNLKSGLGIGKSEGAKWSAGKVSGDSVHYNHPEHGTVSIQKQPTGDFHVKHQGKMAGLGGVKGSFGTSKEAGTHAKNYMQAVSQKKILAPKMHNISSTQLMGKSEIKKAITAGSTNAAPSTLVNGAAYQAENLRSESANTGAEDHKFHASKKQDWNKRAKQDYDQWPHKEKFEKFMQARMPHLQLGEIRALGRVIALKKSIDFEKSLQELISVEKSEKAKKELKEK